MQRFKLYLTIFIVFTIVYILSGFNQRLDSIGSLVFIISSILYVFSFEEMPKSNDDLQYTDVYYYFKTRTNSYGNLMMLTLIGITLLFVTIYFTFNVSLIISTLLSWTSMSLAIYFITKSNLQKQFIKLVQEYVLEKLPQINPTELLKLLETLEVNNGKITSLNVDQVMELDLLEPYHSTLKTADLHFIIEVYLEFKAIALGKVISEEIAAINEKYDRPTRTNS